MGEFTRDREAERRGQRREWSVLDEPTPPCAPRRAAAVPTRANTDILHTGLGSTAPRPGTEKTSATWKRESAALRHAMHYARATQVQRQRAASLRRGPTVTLRDDPVVRALEKYARNQEAVLSGQAQL